MHHGQLGGEAGVGEVRVERLQLRRAQHALVHERAGGEGREVDPELVLGPLAHAEDPLVQLQLRGVPLRRRRTVGGRGRGSVRRARGRDEDLHERGHHRAGGGPHGILDHRDVPPAQHRELLGAREVLESCLELGQVGSARGHERRAHGVGTARRQSEVHALPQEVVRDLGEDAGAVARALVPAHRAAVLEVAQRGQGGVHDVVGGRAVQGGDHREAARVLLVLRAVQPLVLGHGGEPLEGRDDLRAGPGGRVGCGLVLAGRRVGRVLLTHDGAPHQGVGWSGASTMPGNTRWVRGGRRGIQVTPVSAPLRKGCGFVGSRGSAPVGARGGGSHAVLR